MGYSDLGCFGGEIQAPNLDALAKRGLRATNFYVGPTCSPTRSSAFSGFTCTPRDHRRANTVEALVGGDVRGH
jgi:arylsulfatase A-like enzyme